MNGPIAADNTIGGGNKLIDIVKLPEGVDRNEWLSMNLMDIHRQLKMLFGIVCETCTCPVMTVGQSYEYIWTDNDKPVPTTAAQYIDFTMTWLNDIFDDENVFPSQIGKEFPKDFLKICMAIARRMLRVYGHVYKSHLEWVKEQRAEAHLNTSYKQFYLFAKQFDLLTEQDLEPMQDITRLFDSNT